MNKIILIGYMGVGKSSVAQALASHLSWSCIDTDDLIESKEKMSINGIFKTKGERYFRELESDLIKDLLANPGPMIVATGGGMPMQEGFFKLLKKKKQNYSIYLRLSEAEIVKRLQNRSQDRPLVKDLEAHDLKRDIKNRLSLRRPVYQQADLKVNVKGKTVESICQRIIKLLKQKDI